MPAGLAVLRGFKGARAALLSRCSRACNVPRICATATPPDDGGGMPQICQRL
ncbi:hypothetical protein D3C76_1306180 [compost metagenome]